MALFLPSSFRSLLIPAIPAIPEIPAIPAIPEKLKKAVDTSKSLLEVIAMLR